MKKFIITLVLIVFIIIIVNATDEEKNIKKLCFRFYLDNKNNDYELKNYMKKKCASYIEEINNFKNLNAYSITMTMFIMLFASILTLSCNSR